MTVSTTTARNVKVGNGTTKSFPFDFAFEADGDLVVTLVITASGVEVLQILVTDYTTTGGSGATGTIEMIVAPASTEQLVIERDLAYTQSVDYQPNDPFPAEVNETALDRVTFLVQQVLDFSQRGLRLKKNTTLTEVTFPDPEVDKILVGKNATEFQNKTISDLDPTVTTLPLSIADGGTNAITETAARGALGTMEIVNVKADHAAVGDGVADDTAEVQAASDAGTGKIVFFPAGTYLVGALTITKKQHWMLAPNAIIKLKDNADVNLLTINVDGWSMEGGKLDGNKANQGSDQNGITINNDNITITNVEVRNAGNYGIVARDCAHPVIDKCKIYDSGDIGIFVEVTTTASQEGGVVTDNLVDRSGVAANAIVQPGIDVRGDDSSLFQSRARVTGNYVLMTTNPDASTAICIQIFGLGRHTVVGDNATSGGSMGISISNSDSTTVTGNNVFNPKTLGIELALSNDCAVVGNTIDGNALGTKGISVSNTNPQHNTLTGNTIKGFSDRGIQVSNGLETVISGNTVFVGATPGYAIEIVDSVHTVISGNMLHGNAAGERGIVLLRSDRCVISGNGLFNFTAFGIILVAAETFTFTNIIIVGNNLNTTTVPISTSLSSGGAIGSEIRAIGNTGLVRNAFKMDILSLLGDVISMTGTSSPNTVVTAGIGSIFHRTDAGPAGYVKTSGTGNTLWSAIAVV